MVGGCPTYSLLVLALCAYTAGWQCPAVKEVCGHKCSNDRDCTNKGKCCAFDCVYACWSLVEYTRDMLNCPARSEVMPTSCYDTCRSDSECPGGRKCCYSDCGHTCYPPVKYERVKAVICPAYDDPRELRCDYPCNSDSDCLDMGRCCNFPCGQSCWWSPSDAFITATVMGECTYQESAAEGEQDVRLSCQLKVNNSQPLNITWYKGDTPLPNGHGRVHSEKLCEDPGCRSVTTNLVFDSVHMQDEGKYMMIVSSGREKYGHAVNLTLYNKPYIEVTPALSTVHSGDHVDLTCRIINLDRTKPYYKAGIKLKWCHRGLSNAAYNGIHTHGFGEETLRLTNVSGDVVIGCGLNSTECTVTAEIKVLPNDNNGCPVSVDIRRYQWPWTRAGQSRVAPCPRGYAGTASRSCSAVSTWFYPNYYRCVSERLRQVDRQLSKFRTGELSAGHISPVVVNLDEAVGELNLTSGDLDRIASSISEIVIIIKITKKGLGDRGRESFINIVSNSLSRENLQEWDVVLKEVVKLNQSTISALLRSVSEFGLLTAEERPVNDDPVHMIKETILFGAGKSQPQDLTFPQRGRTAYNNRGRQRRAATESTSISVKEESIRALLGDSASGDIAWTYAIYSTLDDVINLADHPDTARSMDGFGEVQVVSDVVSVQLGVPGEATLDPPLSARMNIQPQASPGGVRTCARFIPQSGSVKAQWTSEGCQLQVNGSDVICQCDKLGHIAVLEKVPAEGRVKTLILKASCAAPLIAAIVIAIVKFRRGCCLPSSVLGLNLSLCLLLCYTLFAVAIDMVQHQTACSVVGAVLQLLVTLSSVSILAQSAHLLVVYTRTLRTYPIASSSHRGPYVSLTVAVWVVGGVIVAATLGILSPRGYGTSELCWITTNYGASYAILGPEALVLVLVFCALLWCVRSSNHGDGSKEEKMVMQVSEKKKYLEMDTSMSCRRNTLLKQSLRCVLVLLHLLRDVIIVLLVGQTELPGMPSHLLEYMFAGIHVLQMVILIFVDACLKDIEHWTETEVGSSLRADDNIYEEVLDAK